MRSILKWFLILLMLTIFGFLIYFQMQIVKNPVEAMNLIKYKPINVLSGSMRPKIEVGDMIIIKDIQKDEIQIGDIVTFKVNDKTLVTHRVIQIVLQDNQTLFKTQGDSNNVSDENLVYENQLVGKVIFKIPYGGYISNFIRGKVGFSIFIILPTLLLVIGEVRNIVYEISRRKIKNNEEERIYAKNTN